MSQRDANLVIEGVVHEAITRALQSIADEFGIRVTGVRVGWTEVTGVEHDREQFAVSGVEIIPETGRR